MEQHDPALHFHRAEFDALRAELLHRQRAMDFILYFSLVGSSIAAAWLHGAEGAVPPLLWFAPFALSVLSLFTYYRKSNGNARIGGYIRKIEQRYADKGVGGWESSGKPARAALHVSVWSFWLILLVTTFTLAAARVGLPLPEGIGWLLGA